MCPLSSVVPQLSWVPQLHLFISCNIILHFCVDPSPPNAHPWQRRIFLVPHSNGSTWNCKMQIWKCQAHTKLKTLKYVQYCATNMYRLQIWVAWPNELASAPGVIGLELRWPNMHMIWLHLDLKLLAYDTAGCTGCLGLRQQMKWYNGHDCLPSRSCFVSVLVYISLQIVTFFCNIL